MQPAIVSFTCCVKQKHFCFTAKSKTRSMFFVCLFVFHNGCWARLWWWVRMSTAVMQAWTQIFGIIIKQSSWLCSSQSIITLGHWRWRCSFKFSPFIICICGIVIIIALLWQMCRITDYGRDLFLFMPPVYISSYWELKRKSPYGPTKMVLRVFSIRRVTWPHYKDMMD